MTVDSTVAKMKIVPWIQPASAKIYMYRSFLYISSMPLMASTPL